MIVDVNVNLSRWPFRRLPHDETPKLVAKLRAGGVTQALACSFDAVLQTDVAAVNKRLVDECKMHGEGLLLPIGTVNPMLPDWLDDLRRCHEVHEMTAIRLHPNYHGYKLDAPKCIELLSAATARKLVVQIAMKMEDVRTHHRLVQVPTVDVTPLPAVMANHPDLKVVVLNNYSTLRGEALTRLAKSGEIYFDISHAEQVGALEKLIKAVPFERLLFGSHFPFFNLEATLLKFRESRLGQFVTDAIQHKNAERLFGLTLPER